MLLKSALALISSNPVSGQLQGCWRSGSWAQRSVYL